MMIMSGLASRADPFILNDDIAGHMPWRSTAGLSIRSQVVNPAQNTLVLIVAGQSNWTNITPTTYLPTNSSAIDQFNVYDGGSYSIGSGVLGASFAAGYGLGNLSVRVADTLITNGKFDRVIIVNIGVGGSSVADWATGNISTRNKVAMLRLASRGIDPAIPGVTFAYLWGQGENDTALATSQAAYSASLTAVLGQLSGIGFSGRYFICKETWATGSVSAAVQAAQTGILNGSTIFSGGDLDTLNATNRQADNTHFNDTGAAAAAGLVISAMAASGAPF